MEFQIRPVQPGDGSGINLLRRMPGVFENTLGIPSERVTRNEEMTSSPDRNLHSMVAVAQDNSHEIIVGMAMLSVNANPRARHSGGIGIMVHAGYQNQGVGTALMGALLDIADNWLMLTRVELGVFCDNERAIHLYEKLGFVKEGVKRKAAIRFGKLEDEYMMARIRED